MKTTRLFFYHTSFPLRMRNVSGERGRGNQNTHFVLDNLFFENHVVYEIM